METRQDLTILLVDDDPVGIKALEKTMYKRGCQVAAAHEGPPSKVGATRPMKDRLFSVDEICEYLGISRDTAYKWIDRRGLPAYRLGRLWKFRKQEVDKWIKQGAGACTSGKA